MAGQARSTLLQNLDGGFDSPLVVHGQSVPPLLELVRVLDFP
jgi:hypothetical protein